MSLISESSVLPHSTVQLGMTYLREFLEYCITFAMEQPWKLVAGGAIVTFTATVWSPLRHYMSFTKKPPGPWRNWTPIVGYLLAMGTKPSYITMMELAEVYGPVYRLHLGKTVIAVVTDPILVRSAFLNPKLSGRLVTPLVEGVVDGLGIASSDGNFWRKQRVFSMGCMMKLGVKCKSQLTESRFDVHLVKGMKRLVDRVATQCNTEFDPESIILFSVANVVMSTFTSTEFAENNASLLEQLHDLQNSFEQIELVGYANFLSFSMWFPWVRKVRDQLLERREKTRKFFRDIVNTHKTEILAGRPADDFIDMYLAAIGDSSEESSEHSELQLLAILADFFSAGTITTTATFRWLLLAFIRHPEVQVKIQKEIDTIIGARSPDLKQMEFMPYTLACIQEILRLSSIVPVGNLHLAHEDTELGGFIISKGSAVLGLSYAVHRDPLLWTRSAEFYPEHFLDRNGQFIDRQTQFMPFSVGRRECLGQDLARSQIFMMTTFLLQKFTFTPGQDMEKLPLWDDVNPGIVRAPKSFKIEVQYRPLPDASLTSE